LYSERGHVLKSGSPQDHRDTSANPRGRAGNRERLHHPAERVVGQLDTRFRPRGSDIELDGDEQPTRPKISAMVLNDLYRIGHVEQQEPLHDRIERRFGAPAPRVGFDERDVAGAGFLDATAGDVECVAGLIDTDDRALRTDELADQSRHVAQPGAEVEHSKTSSQSCSLQHHASRSLDRRRLTIET
jgi:hypothetical protein